MQRARKNPRAWFQRAPHADARRLGLAQLRERATGCCAVKRCTPATEMAHAASSHTQCDMCEAFATHTKMKRHRPVGGSFLGGASLLRQASGKLHGSSLSSGCCVGCCRALATQDFLTRKRRFASPIKCCSGPGHQLHRHHHPFPNQRHLKAQTSRVARQELLRPRPPSAPPTRLLTPAPSARPGRKTVSWSRRCSAAQPYEGSLGALPLPLGPCGDLRQHSASTSTAMATCATASSRAFRQSECPRCLSGVSTWLGSPSRRSTARVQPPISW